MQSIKIGIITSVSACLLAVTATGAMAAPLSGLGVASQPIQAQQQRPTPQQPVPNETQPLPGQTQPSQPLPGQDQASSSTFTGTIMKDGEQFLLKDSSGTVYRLDDSSRASTFEGKSVKVTGKLDTNAKMIHVEAIEAVSA